jgi:hypothetical protein
MMEHMLSDRISWRYTVTDHADILVDGVVVWDAAPADRMWSIIGSISIVLEAKSDGKDRQ